MSQYFKYIISILLYSLAGSISGQNYKNNSPIIIDHVSVSENFISKNLNLSIQYTPDINRLKKVNSLHPYFLFKDINGELLGEYKPEKDKPFNLLDKPYEYSCTVPFRNLELKEGHHNDITIELCFSNETKITPLKIISYRFFLPDFHLVTFQVEEFRVSESVKVDETKKKHFLPDPYWTIKQDLTIYDSPYKQDSYEGYTGKVSLIVPMINDFKLQIFDADLMWPDLIYETNIPFPKPEMETLEISNEKIKMKFKFKDEGKVESLIQDYKIDHYQDAKGIFVTEVVFILSPPKGFKEIKTTVTGATPSLEENTVLDSGLIRKKLVFTRNHLLKYLNVEINFFPVIPTFKITLPPPDKLVGLTPEWKIEEEAHFDNHRFKSSFKLNSITKDLEKLSCKINYNYTLNDSILQVFDNWLHEKPIVLELNSFMYRTNTFHDVDWISMRTLPVSNELKLKITGQLNCSDFFEKNFAKPIFFDTLIYLKVQKSSPLQVKVSKVNGKKLTAHHPQNYYYTFTDTDFKNDLTLYQSDAGSFTKKWITFSGEGKPLWCHENGEFVLQIFDGSGKEVFKKVIQEKKLMRGKYKIRRGFSTIAVLEAKKIF
jgi:hypothetical protein